MKTKQDDQFWIRLCVWFIDLLEKVKEREKIILKNKQKTHDQQQT